MTGRGHGCEGDDKTKPEQTNTHPPIPLTVHHPPSIALVVRLSRMDMEEDGDGSYGPTEHVKHGSRCPSHPRPKAAVAMLL